MIDQQFHPACRKHPPETRNIAQEGSPALQRCQSLRTCPPGLPTFASKKGTGGKTGAWQQAGKKIGTNRQHEAAAQSAVDRAREPTIAFRVGRQHDRLDGPLLLRAYSRLTKQRRHVAPRPFLQLIGMLIVGSVVEQVMANHSDHDQQPGIVIQPRLASCG